MRTPSRKAGRSNNFSASPIPNAAASLSAIFPGGFKHFPLHQLKKCHNHLLKKATYEEGIEWYTIL